MSDPVAVEAAPPPAEEKSPDDKKRTYLPLWPLIYLSASRAGSWTFWLFLIVMVEWKKGKDKYVNILLFVFLYIYDHNKRTHRIFILAGLIMISWGDQKWSIHFLLIWFGASANGSYVAIIPVLFLSSYKNELGDKTKLRGLMGVLWIRTHRNVAGNYTKTSVLIAPFIYFAFWDNAPGYSFGLTGFFYIHKSYINNVRKVRLSICILFRYSSTRDEQNRISRGILLFPLYWKSQGFYLQAPEQGVRGGLPYSKRLFLIFGRFSGANKTTGAAWKLNMIFPLFWKYTATLNGQEIDKRTFVLPLAYVGRGIHPDGDRWQTRNILLMWHTQRFRGDRVMYRRFVFFPLVLARTNHLLDKPIDTFVFFPIWWRAAQFRDGVEVGRSKLLLPLYYHSWSNEDNGDRNTLSYILILAKRQTHHNHATGASEEYFRVFPLIWHRHHKQANGSTTQRRTLLFPIIYASVSKELDGTTIARRTLLFPIYYRHSRRTEDMLITRKITALLFWQGRGEYIADRQEAYRYFHIVPLLFTSNSPSRSAIFWTFGIILRRIFTSQEGHVIKQYLVTPALWHRSQTSKSGGYVRTWIIAGIAGRTTGSYNKNENGWENVLSRHSREKDSGAGGDVGPDGISLNVMGQQTTPVIVAAAASPPPPPPVAPAPVYSPPPQHYPPAHAPGYYPPQQGQYPPPGPVGYAPYPPQQPGYYPPPQPYGQPGYPPHAAPGYPPQQPGYYPPPQPYGQPAGYPPHAPAPAPYYAPAPVPVAAPASTPYPQFVQPVKNQTRFRSEQCSVFQLFLLPLFYHMNSTQHGRCTWFFPVYIRKKYTTSGSWMYVFPVFIYTEQCMGGGSHH